VQTTIVWLYVIPAKVEGEWKAVVPTTVSRKPMSLKLKQQMIRVSGSAIVDGKDIPLEEVRLRGERLSFRLSGRKGEFTGLVKGNSIEGTVDTGGAKAPWSATLGG
jgi:hypothetical protein